MRKDTGVENDVKLLEIKKKLGVTTSFDCFIWMSCAHQSRGLSPADFGPDAGSTLQSGLVNRQPFTLNARLQFIRHACFWGWGSEYPDESLPSMRRIQVSIPEPPKREADVLKTFPKACRGRTGLNCNVCIIRVFISTYKSRH